MDGRSWRPSGLRRQPVRSVHRLRSRAIGEPGRGLPVEIQTLAFGTETEFSIPTPGDTRWFRIRPAPGLSSAQLTLQTLQGDARWAVRRGFVPATTADSGSFSIPGGQIRTGNPGNEYITWGARSADSFIPDDDHFIVVAAEGAPTNPDNGFLGIGETRVRIGSAAFTPRFLGEIFPGRDLVQPDTYDAGEVLGYEFEIPAGTRAVEIRLEDRVGTPVFELGRGAGFLSGSPGWFDGFASSLLASRVRQFTLPEPAAGRYWIAVGRSESQATAASFRLRVRSLVPQPMAFSALQNSETRTNVVNGSLADGQRAYFSVEVPEILDGTPVIGWNLRLESSLGTPQVRVRPGSQLPEDSNRNGSQFFTRGLIVAPPFLTPGKWTIEVRGFGDSQFTLRSERVQLERPAWTFPSALEPITPIHTADTHFLADGTELTNDVDLGQEQYHFYALDIPPDNGGLLRAELIALSGNSDLYVRAGNVPSREAARMTSDFGATGAHDFSLASGRVSEFANWVPADTRREAVLTPGRWYFLIHANGSNVRYRLRLTRGEVVVANSLTLTRANENVAAGDWRYFRFSVPQNPPQFWDVNVSQQQGDIDVHFRDAAPPGLASNGGLMGWEHEQKNTGVDYRSYPTPGTWRFSVPQLRPGQAYFVGIRGNVDSVFSLNTSETGPLLDAAFPPFEPISPAGGLVSGTLAPAERRTWLVQTPLDALRLKLTGTNASSVQFYLQNGSVPWASRNNPGDHWSGGGVANARFDTGLLDRSSGNWPWIRGDRFYIAVTNESASPQPFALRVDTRAWRLDLAATNGAIQSNPLKPFYDDGETVSLTPTPAPGHRFAGWTIDLSGTNQPGLVTFNAHKRVVALFEPIPYRLSLSATGGTIVRVPASDTYPYGSTVRLTAVPSPGYEFVRWSGTVDSVMEDIEVPILGDTTLTAHFNRFADPPEFTGTASADGVPSPISGVNFVENTAAHPADTDANLRLGLDEVTGYGAAWKRGEPWSVAPNPIPVNYVTRAGFLWRVGETYRLDASVGGAPTWWIPGAASGSGRIAGPAIDPVPTLHRTVNGNSVTLSVVPGTGVSAYAIEERLFVGFNAIDISAGGSFQSSDGMLRWGPFFDNQPRTFTYRLVPPAGFDGEIALLGLLSADGESFPATGQAIVRFGSTPLPPPVRTDLEGDRLALDLSGPLNARVLIETAEAIGAPWTLATEFQLSRPGQDWSVPVEIQNSGRFFRVRIEVP